jgi:hypothetical protein
VRIASINIAPDVISLNLGDRHKAARTLMAALAHRSPCGVDEAEYVRWRRMSGLSQPVRQIGRGSKSSQTCHHQVMVTAIAYLRACSASGIDEERRSGGAVDGA